MCVGDRPPFPCVFVWISRVEVYVFGFGLLCTSLCLRTHVHRYLYVCVCVLGVVFVGFMHLCLYPVVFFRECFNVHVFVFALCFGDNGVGSVGVRVIAIRVFVCGFVVCMHVRLFVFVCLRCVC